LPDNTAMPTQDVHAILKLEVPVIVRLAHRKMKLNEVLNLQPGSMVELPKLADEPLDLMVNNKLIGRGTAVKVGENFGLKVAAVGDAAERIRALGPGVIEDDAPAESGNADADADAGDAAEDDLGDVGDLPDDEAEAQQAD